MDMTEAVQQLSVASVRPNPNQPRKIFDEAGIADLALSIDRQGLLQPITVRPVADGAYEIVAGERRWRAHCHLGRETVPAVVRTMTDDEMADAAIVENLQRKDLQPIEEAMAYQARLDTGITVEELAERLGLKQAWRITERTALLKLLPELLEALRIGILSPSQATELSRHPDNDQRILFGAIKGGKCETYAALRLVSQALFDRRNQTTMFTDTGCKPKLQARAEERVTQRISKLVAFVKASFDRDGQPDLAQHLPASKAESFAIELDLVERHIKALRLSLLASSVLGAAASPPQKATA